MCQFGTEEDIIEELSLSREEALIGWRNNYITHSFNENEKFLRSLNYNYLFPKDKPADGIGLLRNNSLGIYNYNNYNNNYYYYYNYYYHNYYYYYNYYYYRNNNYYTYNIQIKTIHYGKVFKYKDGYRSEFCIPTHLVTIDQDNENSKWFSYPKTKFANHFDNLIKSLAKEYNCEVIEYSKMS